LDRLKNRAVKLHMLWWRCQNGALQMTKGTKYAQNCGVELNKDFSVLMTNNSRHLGRQSKGERISQK